MSWRMREDMMPENMSVTLAVALLWMELSADLIAEVPLESLVREVSEGYKRQLHFCKGAQKLLKTQW